MAVLYEMEKRGHERVFHVFDKASGLRCIIAVHDTTLGPALGGTRMSLYKTEQDALVDVLRLSRGMTYKSAVADLSLGGGKAVIIADPAKDKSEELFLAYGRAIDQLGGLYITAEDVGTTVADMEIVRKATRWVTGLPENLGGSGDPSPVTAFGVYRGMQAAMEIVFGSGDFRRRSIAIPGLGKVGYPLAVMMAKDGAQLFVADVNQVVAQQVQRELGATIVHPDEIATLSVDILAPCARGAIINNRNVYTIKAKIIAGAANNQLEDDSKQGPVLFSKGITYVVDFVINAGGVINVYSELDPAGFSREKALGRASSIYDRVKELLTISRSENIPTTDAAMMMVERRLEAARKK